MLSRITQRNIVTSINISTLTSSSLYTTSTSKKKYNNNFSIGNIIQSSQESSYLYSKINVSQQQNNNKKSLMGKNNSFFSQYNNYSVLKNKQIKNKMIQKYEYSTDTYPEHEVLGLVAASPTMEEGAIEKWYVKEGDFIEEGGALCSVESDKSTSDWFADDEGYVAKILIEEGTKGIPVLTPVAIIVPNKEDIDAFKDYKVEKPSSGSNDNDKEKEKEKKEETPVKEKSKKKNETKASSGSDVTFSMVEESGIKMGLAPKFYIVKNNITDFASIPRSGPQDRLLKGDVIEYLENGGKTTQQQQSSASGEKISKVEQLERKQDPESNYVDEPLTNMRKTIASRLLESKQTYPHGYFTAKSQIDNLLKLRVLINEQLKNSDGDIKKISINDMIIKTAAISMKQYLQNHKNQTKDSIDVAVAVAIDNGLITPIIRNANNLSLPDISREMRSLASRAKSNELKPEEYQGGDFTISNLGMFDISHFTAVINPPQQFIIACASGVQEVLPINGVPTVSTSLSYTLSSNMQLMSEVETAEYITLFKDNLSNPNKLLL